MPHFLIQQMLTLGIATLAGLLAAMFFGRWLNMRWAHHFFSVVHLITGLSCGWDWMFVNHENERVSTALLIMIGIHAAGIAMQQGARLVLYDKKQGEDESDRRARAA
ncbi:MAG: hypothetical protein ABIJ46_00800 [bacterium]